MLRKNIVRGMKLVLFLGVVGLLTGCVQQPPPHSGFLKKYANLQPDPADNSLLYWEKAGVDWEQNRKLLRESLKDEWPNDDPDQERGH
jgi:hypothetical protein